MNTGQLILGGAAIFFIGRYVFKQVIQSAQDQLAKTPLGSVGVIRSSDAEKAAWNILNTRWLTKSYRDKLLSPDLHVFDIYNIDGYTDENLPDGIAKMIIDSNYRIFPNDVLDRLAAIGLSPIIGAIDNPNKLLDAFSGIKNQVQALQVTYWYWSRTGGKDLNKGVQWLPDQYIIELEKYLKTLPTGVTPKTPANSDMLQSLPNV